MINLDKPTEFLELDTQDQFKWIDNWEGMLEIGFKAGQNIKIPSLANIGSKTIKYSSNYSNMLICGMGGSAISGEYLQNFLAKSNFNLPIQIIRGYELPGFVSSSSLVFIITYSGNTRETLFCLHQAIIKEARIVIISSGGTALEVAAKYTIPFVKLEKGYQPRASLPLIFATLTGIVFAIFPQLNSLIKEFDHAVSSIKQKSQELQPKIPLKNNLAKTKARNWLKGKTIVFITYHSSLGMRMKGQLNENAKIISFYELFPELMHNSVQGWQNQSRNDFHFVILKLSSDSNEINKKVDFSLKLANGDGNSSELLEIDGSGFLAQLITATFLVDYISLYMAILQGYDPSEIKIISGMKKQFEPKLNLEFNIKNELMSFN